MKKKIIVKVAAGVGNQMFMYAHSYALAKKLNCELLIDNTSGFFQKKNTTHDRTYCLNFFSINSQIADKKFKFDTYFFHIIKKILKILDKFKKKKSFLNEPKSKNKITFFKNINTSYSNKIYVEGYFESEKYFVNYQKDLIKEFTIKKELIDINNQYINILKNSNSISIHIRRNRLIEPKYFSDNPNQKIPPQLKKDFTLNDVFDYIFKSINYFEKTVPNPKFFIWSNNFHDLDKIFDKKQFTFIQNNTTSMDFYLFKFAKHFIVGPSSFHWWGAWLNTNENKICARPPNSLNPSNNTDFWPDSWKKID